MPMSRALSLALILTMEDEPALICETSEELDAWRSSLDPDMVEAARIVGDWVETQCPAPVFH